jgi:hypothetical protein
MSSADEAVPEVPPVRGANDEVTATENKAEAPETEPFPVVDADPQPLGTASSPPQPLLAKELPQSPHPASLDEKVDDRSPSLSASGSKVSEQAQSTASSERKVRAQSMVLPPSRRTLHIEVILATGLADTNILSKQVGTNQALTPPPPP